MFVYVPFISCEIDRIVNSSTIFVCCWQISSLFSFNVLNKPLTFLQLLTARLGWLWTSCWYDCFRWFSFMRTKKFNTPHTQQNKNHINHFVVRSGWITSKLSMCMRWLRYSENGPYCKPEEKKIERNETQRGANQSIGERWSFNALFNMFNKWNGAVKLVGLRNGCSRIFLRVLDDR